MTANHADSTTVYVVITADSGIIEGATLFRDGGQADEYAREQWREATGSDEPDGESLTGTHNDDFDFATASEIDEVFEIGIELALADEAVEVSAGSLREGGFPLETLSRGYRPFLPQIDDVLGVTIAGERLEEHASDVVLRNRAVEITEDSNLPHLRLAFFMSRCSSPYTNIASSVGALWKMEMTS